MLLRYGVKDVLFRVILAFFHFHFWSCWKTLFDQLLLYYRLLFALLLMRSVPCRINHNCHMLFSSLVAHDWTMASTIFTFDLLSGWVDIVMVTQTYIRSVIYLMSLWDSVIYLMKCFSKPWTSPNSMEMISGSVCMQYWFNIGCSLNPTRSPKP